MIKVYRPPNDRFDRKAPLMFLAGPIQGTGDWQSAAIEFMNNLAPEYWEIAVACPRRLVFEKLDDAGYERQVEWEREYLNVADVILFWLAKETEHNCSRSYAQTTRFELGEAVGMVSNRLIAAPTLVVGIEEGFSGARYIQKVLAGKKNVERAHDLEGACALALTALAKRTG